MKLITREFNMDSSCVELQFDNGTTLDIDCTVIEYKITHTILRHSELERLVYNALLDYESRRTSPSNYQDNSTS